MASIENKTKQTKRTSKLLNSPPTDCKYPSTVTALFVCSSSNPMFLALYPLHYRIGFPVVLPFVPKDLPSFTKKFEKSATSSIKREIRLVVAVELGIKLFFICFHIQLPPPPPEKGVTDHVWNRERKKCFKCIFFFMTLGSPSSEP